MDLSDLYPSPQGKLALAQVAGCHAKVAAVTTEGIGEDLHLNLMGWRDDRLVVLAQMVYEAETNLDRLQRTATAAHILRAGYGVNAFVVLLEGYGNRSVGDRSIAPSRFAEEFANGNPEVIEGLIAYYIDEHISYMVITPYTYTVPRGVEFAPAVVHDPELPEQSAYGRALSTVLREVRVATVPRRAEAFYASLAEGLDTVGFVLTHTG